MKKKIMQWLIGLMISALGFAVLCMGIDAVFSFMDMVNNTGEKSVGYFLRFIFDLFMIVIAPYIVYKEIEDGVSDKFK